MANKHTALSWFRSFKAFDNRHDDRTYTQILSAHPKSQNTRSVVILQKNANAKLQGWYENSKQRFPWHQESCATFKVGMKIRSNVSPGIQDRVQVHVQTPRITSSKHVNLLPLQNRFKVLGKIPDNVSDFTYSDARETGARTAQRLHL